MTFSTNVGYYLAETCTSFSLCASIYCFRSFFVMCSPMHTEICRHGYKSVALYLARSRVLPLTRSNPWGINESDAENIICNHVIRSLVGNPYEDKKLKKLPDRFWLMNSRKKLTKAVLRILYSYFNKYLVYLKGHLGEILSLSSNFSYESFNLI